MTKCFNCNSELIKIDKEITLDNQPTIINIKSPLLFCDNCNEYLWVRIPETVLVKQCIQRACGVMAQHHSFIRSGKWFDSIHAHKMKCEYCNEEHKGTYGSGRFCSVKCARGYSTKIKRKEINEKVSKTILRKIKSGEIIPHNKGARIWSEEEKQQTREFMIDRFEKGLLKKFIEAGKFNLNDGIREKGALSFHPTEKLWKPKIDKYFNKNLVKEKIGNHYFDFVDDEFIVEFTLDNTSGISDAIKRFKTILNDGRKKYLISPKIGEVRTQRLIMANVEWIDIGVVAQFGNARGLD